ncbi:MAG: PsbP-related protein [bacterium]|nr:PsbP-related protein [bacterium]
MKLLMEDKKKQMIYLALMLVSLGIMWWVWFGSSNSTPKVQPAIVANAMNPKSATPTPAVGTTQPTMPTGAVTPIGLPASMSQLPYGTDINTGILEDERFRRLVSSDGVSVSPEELGRINPFMPPSSEQVSGLLQGTPYVDSNLKFSFSYPKNWQSATSSSGAVAVFRNPTADIEGGSSYVSNVTVALSDTGGKTTDQVYVFYKLELAKNMADYKLLSEKETNLSDGKLRGLLLEFTSTAGQNKIHQKVLLVVSGSKLFALTAVALDSVWTVQKQGLEESLLSFQVL